MLRLACTVLAVAVMLVAFPARAAPDAAGAEQLFSEGRALMAEKNYDLACPKLEASERLDPGAGTLLNLAGCYELAGKTASAWLTYREAESAAAQSNRPDWARAAHERTELLFPKLSYLTIKVTQRIDKLVIERDGRAIDPAVYGVAIAADPGSHTVRASAPGYEPWSQTVQVGTARVEITVASLVPVKALASVAPRPPASSSWSAQKTLGVAAVGLGVGSLVVGTVFAVKARSTYDDAIAHECGGDVKTCSVAGVDQVGTSHQQATASTVFVIAGAAFAAGGALLFFTAPKPHIDVGFAGSSIALRGVF